MALWRWVMLRRIMNCTEQHHLAELVNPLHIQPNVRVAYQPLEEKQLTMAQLWCMTKIVAIDLVMVSFDICEIATKNIEWLTIILWVNSFIHETLLISPKVRLHVGTMEGVSSS